MFPVGETPGLQAGQSNTWTFNFNGAFPDVQVSSSIDTNAPPIPSEMQAFKLSADNKLDGVKH